jgi:hypothetical protein
MVCFLIFVVRYGQKNKGEKAIGKNKIASKEIHLKKRSTGFITEDDFELVEVEIPEIKRKMNFWFTIFDVSGPLNALHTLFYND